jgi:hypothetical protein
LISTLAAWRERPAVAGDHHAHRQPLDRIQRGIDVVEAGFTVDLGKDDAEAVFPQRVGRDQHAVCGVEQQQRMRIVSGCGDRVPAPTTGDENFSRCQRGGVREALAALAGAGVRQAHRVPCRHRGGVARRHDDRRAEGTLQRGVAAAVIRMQMRVDDALQGLPAQRMAHQRHGLLGMRDVPGVDQHRAALAAHAVDHDVVRRQPAALEHGEALERCVHRAHCHAKNGWSKCATRVSRCNRHHSRNW